MNALARKAVEQRLIAELRALPAGDKPHVGDLRRAIAAELGSCTTADFAAAVQALRYQGKLQWDRLALSASLIADQQDSAGAPAPALEGGGASAENERAPASPPSPKASGGASVMPAPNLANRGPDDDDDYPGEVNDVFLEPGGQHKAPRSAFGANLRRAGVHASQTKAAMRPLPPPKHESEVAQLVREEVNDTVARGALARSTGTVRNPLSVRFGVPDLSLVEGLSSLLIETPGDVMIAVQRKHPELWRAVLLQARSSARRPIQILYAALEAGLAVLEHQQEQADAA